MSDIEELPKISSRERVVYFGLIPLLFTTLLIGTEAYIINHGKGDTFAGAMMKSGGSVLQAGKSMMQVGKSLIGKKPASSAAVGTNSGGNSAGAAHADASNGAASTSEGAAADTGATTASVANPKGSTAPLGTATSNATATTGIPSGTVVQTATDSPSSTPEANLKQQTDAVANQFATMSPSQAAAILGNMTIRDEVYNMLGMKPQQRASILAKMDPNKAVVISKVLEDFPPVTSDNASDVQKKLDNLRNNPQPIEELVKTYSQMPATSAASLITGIMKTNPKTAVTIMSNLDVSTRASILSAMSSSKDSTSVQSAIDLSQMLLKAN